MRSLKQFSETNVSPINRKRPVCCWCGNPYTKLSPMQRTCLGACKAAWEEFIKGCDDE